MKLSDYGGIKKVRCVSKDIHVGHSNVCWGRMGMGCVLFSVRYGVLKLVDCTFKTPWKGKGECAILVFPHHFDTKTFRTVPIGGDFVLSKKHSYEVAGVFFFLEFEAGVVT